MAIHDKPLDRTAVLDVLDSTVDALERDDVAVRTGACDALGIGTDAWSACRDRLIEELLQAEEWMEREDVVAAHDGAPSDSDHGPDFVPSHPTIALLQSAMAERLDAAPRDAFQPRDPRWLSVVYHRLRARIRGKAPFVEHQQLDDFRFTLPSRAVVALVSDWGTANVHAIEVAKQIAARRPDHVIHQGDVYYSGTTREAQAHFLDVWRAYGPAGARYWSLNGNHDMYSGGYGYFRRILPAFGQPASYFSLANGWWRLIGLDSGYVSGTFTTPQMNWLDAQLEGEARTILLTHHHLLSAHRKRGTSLEEWLEPHLAASRLYGWIWGHEHHLVQYADYRGVKCRCIGHGSLPYLPPHLVPPRHPADIVRQETRTSPLDALRGMHGFALLTFDGPVLDIEYVDEAGGTAWTERWD